MKVWHTFCNPLTKFHNMTNRTLVYFSKSKALKILQQPLQADLKTLLSASFALSHNRIVKKHIQRTLYSLAY